MFHRIKQYLRAFLQLRGSTRLKQSLWDQEFSSGRWDYIDHTPNDCIYTFIARYCRRGSILDLGCGAGNTGTELDTHSYSLYTGVDISDVALEKARERSREAGRNDRNTYEQGDIATFTPTRTYDVILFRESIFYIPSPQITHVLRHYRKHLSPGGVIIIRMYDREKHSYVLRAAEQNFTIIETHKPNGVSTIVIVLQ